MALKLSVRINNPGGVYDGLQMDLQEEVDYEKINDITFTVKASNTRIAGTQLSFSDEIVFIGQFSQMLKEVFIPESAGLNIETYVNLTVKDLCCGTEVLLADSVITKYDIKFCVADDSRNIICKISTDVRASDPAASTYICIRSALINTDAVWPDGTSFHNREHIQVPYCNEFRPAVLKYILYLISFVLLACCIFILPVVLLIQQIISVINFILGLLGKDKIDFDKGLSGTQGPLDIMFRVMFEIIPQLMTGCGYQHMGILIRDYIFNVCAQCGITSFNSSILSDSASQYYNSIIVGPTVREGVEFIYKGGSGSYDTQVAKKYFKYNSLIMTGGEFLDSVAELFNAEWWVENNELYMEQNFPVKDPILDLTDPRNKAYSVCFETDEDSTFSGIRLAYELDGVDGVGDEARYLYNDVVPFYDTGDREIRVKRKIKDVNFRFSCSRYEDDLIDDEREFALEDFILTLVTIVYTLAAIVGAIVAALAGSPISGVQVVLRIINEKRFRPIETRGVLLMEKGKTARAKVIALENSYRRKKAKAIRKNKHYNYPFWVSAKFYGGIWSNSDPAGSAKQPEGPNLWQFWGVEDSRIRRSRLSGYTVSFNLDKECYWYADFMDRINSGLSNKYFIVLEVEGKRFNAVFNSIEVRNSATKIFAIVQ